MSTPEDLRQPVLGAEPGRPSRPTQDAAGPWTALLALGLALGVVGWLDVGLLWWPPRLGDAQWEFVIITNTFDALPVATVGTALVAVGVMMRSRHWLTNVSIAVLVVVVFSLAALSVVYLLDVPLALRSTPAAARSVLYRSLFKTGAFAATYTAFYAWLAGLLWRKSRLASR